MNIKYEWTCGNFVSDELLLECSELYSTQYGRWSESAPKNSGEHVKLSPKAIRRWLDNQNSDIYWAKDEDRIIGYAIALQLKTNDGIISWVTQLVVHEDYRHMNIAKNILHSIWGFTDHFAWGIISANPYAIRALEKTTRRRSDPIRIKHNIRKIMNIGKNNLTYISDDTVYNIAENISAINTCFYVDHSNVDKMIDNVVTDTVPWNLGRLDEGWEWIAFTFNDQLPFQLTEEEINNILASSDSVVKTAYSRMVIADKQKWTLHTKQDIDFVIDKCELTTNKSVVDFGCGQGRHSIELAQRGYDVTGVDYVEKNIELAEKTNFSSKNLNLVVGDCRTVTLNRQFDVALCLYDVIGTYVDDDNNRQILNNIYSHLKPNGVAIISVMNRHLTENMAINSFILKDNPNALLSLRPSQTMENTGDIFNPEFYLIDKETGIVYRREQFKNGRSMPVELIVRDKRFYDTEIVELCKSVGFEIDFVRFVNASDWNNELQPLSPKAKEILIKCRKSKP